MALRITRKIGESFDLIWPSGERLNVELSAGLNLHVTDLQSLVEYQVAAPCVLGCGDNADTAGIVIGESLSFDPNQHPIIIDAPRSVRIHRDKMKKGHDHE